MSKKEAILIKRGAMYYIKRDRILFLMLVPAIIGFALFRYAPMYGITIAFRDYNIVEGFSDSPWVGLKYFKQFFADPYFSRLIRNTFLLSFYSLLWGFPAPIIFALALNEVKSNAFKRVTQAISYLPHFISTVVVVGMLYTIVSSDGIINNLLSLLRLEQISFLSNPAWFRTLYISSGIWQNVGFSSIIYLAAISGVDTQLYDAAEIDGCGRFRKMRYITIPSILPTIIVLLILRVSDLLSVGFEKVYLMYNPAIYETADVISTYTYRRGIIGSDFSYASAIGLFNSVISFVLLVFSNYLSRKLTEESLW